AATRRERPLSLRLSEQEHALLHAVAEAEGLPPATLARAVLVAGLRDLEALMPKQEAGVRR
ncbi:MAG TPA: hypothetical protein PKL08_18055, partial [Thermoanaerobaculaceae bacterium]|nr:hypothetical protein [Thermoanaerobaculaceae bacterium]